ncbi:uncharacterized protein LOC117174534 [Belonocnema kinseyi]|uniref:uncharacterized protein LOC117174534 n=1 Tax=Belonocnema kinseyi TaxID=2817044 RepID=UPI00143D6810|nr:uncharacterized protein LOC117174534 [Belonocnema kinseyi]
MFVFPRKRENLMLLDDGPPGSFALYHESGWIQKETFILWFKKFIEFACPTAEKPVLLILDGQTSHTKNIELIRVARDSYFIILSFSPHSKLYKDAVFRAAVPQTAVSGFLKTGIFPFNRDAFPDHLYVPSEGPGDDARSPVVRTDEFWQPELLRTSLPYL